MREKIEALSAIQKAMSSLYGPLDQEPAVNLGEVFPTWCLDPGVTQGSGECGAAFPEAKPARISEVFGPLAYPKAPSSFAV